MKFDDILLSLILRNPSSGYELKRWLAKEGQFLRANADQSQIYRTLHRLLKKGFIEFTVQRGGGPDARIYSGTKTGADHLLALARAPYRPPARWQEADFVARYSCVSIFDPPSVVPLIEIELGFRRKQVAQYRNRERRLDVGPGPLPVDVDVAKEMWDDLHSYSAAATDAWIEWLEAQLAKWGDRFPQEAQVRSAASS